MQSRTRVISFVAVASLALVAVATPSGATSSCRDDAKQTFHDCKADAKEAYQSAKDACLNRDHQCVEACRADRYDCRLATGFDAAIDSCNADLDAAKEQCRNDHPGAANYDARDACIDQAQVVAFQCRDQARENAKPALKVCRANFVTCAKACPPAPEGAPADPVQCKIDAKTQYKSDKAGCVEDFQVQKDACRNKDHLCVEQCRSNRADCRAPVQQQLDQDIQACNQKKCVGGTNDGANCSDISECPGATKCQRPAFTNCDNLYGPNSPNPDPDNFDQCIDNAQVDAFECRDAAHEAAHPGFEQCRQDFQSCVQACPPAS